MKLGLEIGIGKSRPGKGDPLRHPSSKLQNPSPHGEQGPLREFSKLLVSTLKLVHLS